jgi:hypothetical protein
LAGDTAPANALGTLASCSDRIVGLTGTLLGGFADDLFNTLFRLEAGRMKEHDWTCIMCVGISIRATDRDSAI